MNLNELWSPGVAARQVQKAIDTGEFKQGQEVISREGDVLTYFYYHSRIGMYNLKTKALQISSGKSTYSTERKKRLFAKALAANGYDLKPEDDYTKRLLHKAGIPRERLLESLAQPEENSSSKKLTSLQKIRGVVERLITFDTDDLVPMLLKIGSSGKGTAEYETNVKELIKKIASEVKEEDYKEKFEEEI